MMRTLVGGKEGGLICGGPVVHGYFLTLSLISFN
jgi:hypothetical protein